MRKSRRVGQQSAAVVVPEVARQRSTGRAKRQQDKEEPSVISTRPTQRQLAFDFTSDNAGEDDTMRAAEEPLGGQSCAAVTEKPALDSLTDESDGASR